MISFQSLVLRCSYARNLTGWSRLFSGKSVAIVGPAPTVGDQEAEIESHDLIVRVGFEHWPWPGTGNRTDVWVLDSGASRDFLDGKIGLYSTPWVLLKRPEIFRSDLLSLFFGRGQIKGIRARVCRKPRRERWIPSDWNPNQVIMMLVELLSLNPRKVSVFGSDFYTAPKQAYREISPHFKYQSHQSKEFISQMTLAHDQITQKRVAQGVMSRRAWLEGDSRFVTLVNMEESPFQMLLAKW